jgi:uncharacterized oxidoreductase
MKTWGNTILITGGGSGIGFETAKRFSENGNRVILVGRDGRKLGSAVRKLLHASFIEADITVPEQLTALVERVKRDFADLNMLMNNAGRVHIHDVSKSENAAALAREEMQINYFAAVELTTQLLPLLRKAPEAAVINVSSIVAFAPSLMLPTYSASKAALHAYSQVLRLSLASTSNVKVFELMPPLVDTAFAEAIASDKKIPAAQVADELFESMKTDTYEVRVASTQQLYHSFLGAPDKAMLVLNGLVTN